MIATMSPRTRDRKAVLFAAAIVGASSGSAQMWSIFNIPLREAHGWTSSEVSLAYSLFMLAVCLSGFLAGFLQERARTRVLVMASGGVFALGWYLAGFADSVPMLYFTYSLLGGLGCGVIYNTTLAVATKWFPDKRGFANGILLGVMGLAPLAFSLFGNAVIQGTDVGFAFRATGIVVFAMVFACAWMIDVPSQEDAIPEEARVGDALSPELMIGTHDVVREPLFWAMWAALVLAATSGVMLYGHAANIGQEYAGLSASEGASLVGIMALASFAGRIVSGALSDKVGRIPLLLFILACTAFGMAVLFPASSDFPSYALAICVVGACYGGVMTILPSLCGDYFGAAHFGHNYARLYTAYTVAAFVGPLLAAAVHDATGGYELAFAIAASLAACAFAPVLVMRRITKDNGARKRRHLAHEPAGTA